MKTIKPSDRLEMEREQERKKDEEASKKYAINKELTRTMVRNFYIVCAFVILVIVGVVLETIFDMDILEIIHNLIFHN